MTKLLPQGFPPIPQAAIASYAYTDIAEGTGVVKFYGAVHKESTTSSYFLTANTPYSNQIVVSGAATLAGESAWAEKMNKDFDIVFNLPRNIKGKAYLNITIGGSGGGSGSGVPNVQISGASIIHYDGTTETTLATASSEVFVFALNTDVEAKSMLMEFDITSIQHFSKGDTLRLTLPFWARTTGTAGMLSYGFGSDPADRDDLSSAQTIPNTVTTKLELYIPFRIDVGQ